MAAYVEALIGLVRLSCEMRRFEEAERWEAVAARWVRGDADGAARLAAASVDFWMWRGEYDRALLGLETQRLDATDPGTRMVIVARIAVVAAHLGDLDRLGAAWFDAWEMAQSARDVARSWLFRTYVELLRAATLRGEPSRAASAFRAAAQHVSGAEEEAFLAEINARPSRVLAPSAGSIIGAEPSTAEEPGAAAR